MFLLEFYAVSWSWSLTGWEYRSVSFGFRSYNRVDFDLYLQSLKQGNDVCTTTAWLWRQSDGGKVISIRSFFWSFAFQLFSFSALWSRINQIFQFHPLLKYQLQFFPISRNFLLTTWLVCLSNIKCKEIIQKCVRTLQQLMVLRWLTSMMFDIRWNIMTKYNFN